MRPIKEIHIDEREFFGSCMTGLGESANLVVEVIVLAKASLPYEIYRMICLPLKIYRSMAYDQGWETKGE